MAISKSLDDRVWKAAQLVRQRKAKNPAVAARLMNVPAYTVRRRLRGMKSLWSRKATNRLLTDGEEKGLLTYLTRLYNLGTLPTLRMIRDAARHTLWSRNQPAKDPSRWINKQHELKSELPPLDEAYIPLATGADSDDSDESDDDDDSLLGDDFDEQYSVTQATTKTSSNDLGPRVSNVWAHYFCKRHGISVRKARSKDIARMNAEDPVRLQQFYTRWQEAIEHYGVQAADIYNYDETGFHIGESRNTQLVADMRTYAGTRAGTRKRRGTAARSTQQPRAQLTIARMGRREHVTVGECISADGDVMQPLIIFKGKRLQRRFFARRDVPGDYLLAMSTNASISDVLMIRWLQYFDEYSKKRQQGEYRVLLFDNHTTHLTLAFLDYAEANKIVLFTFNSHTTHLCQPLDVVVFRQYKKRYRELVSEAYIYGSDQADKVDFLSALHPVRSQAFTSKIIKAGWRSAGLWPYDPDLVISTLPAPPRQKTPEDHSLDERLRQISTPHSSGTFSKLGASILASPILQSPQSSIDAPADPGLFRVLQYRHAVLNKQIEKMQKGAEAMIVEAQLTSRMNDSLAQSINTARTRSRSTRGLNYDGGIVQFSDARDHVAALKKKEEEQAAKRALTAMKRKETIAKKKRLEQESLAIARAEAFAEGQKDAEYARQQQRERDRIEMANQRYIHELTMSAYPTSSQPSFVRQPYHGFPIRTSATPGPSQFTQYTPVFNHSPAELQYYREASMATDVGAHGHAPTPGPFGQP